jgi:hypothetical protein
MMNYWVLDAFGVADVQRNRQMIRLQASKSKGSLVPWPVLSLASLCELGGTVQETIDVPAFSLHDFPFPLSQVILIILFFEVF